MMSLMDAAGVAKLADDLIGSSGKWETIQIEGNSIVVRRDGMVAKWNRSPRQAGDELTGFRHLSQRVPGLVPELIAHDGPLLVMEDIGTGRSMADAFLTGDRAEARAHLEAYTDGLSRLHEATWLGPDEPGDVGNHGLLFQLARDAAEGNDRLTRLGLWEAAQAELEGMVRMTTSEGPAIFTIGDMCPGNQKMTETGMKMFDLEAAGYQHPALDVTYLVVPWPTCWCCWDLPEEIRDEMVERYLSQSSRPSEVEDGMAGAMMFWAVASVAFGSTAEPDGDDGQIRADLGLNTPMRSHAAVTRVKRTLDYPGVRDGFPRLAEWLVHIDRLHLAQWGECEPLLVAPAFR